MIAARVSPVGSKILLVVKDAETRRVLRDVLITNGHSVELVEATDEIESFLKYDDCDLVIFDLKFRAFDAVETAAWVELFSKRGQRPIIAIVDRDEDHQTEQLLKAGVDDLLPQPLNQALLLHHTNRLLGKPPAKNFLQPVQVLTSGVAPLREIEARANPQPQVLCEIDAEGNLKKIYPELINFLGYPTAEIYGKKLDEFINAGDRQQPRAWLSTLLKTGSARLQLITKDNRHVWATITANKKVDESGQLLSAELIVMNRSDRRPTKFEYERVQAALNQRERELTALNAAGRAITSSLNLQRVFVMVAEQMQSLLVAEFTCVLMRDPATSDFVIVATAGGGSNNLEGARLSAAAGVAGWITREREALVLADAQTDSRHDGSLDRLIGIETRSLIAVPLKFQGTLRGIAQAVDRTAGRFDRHHQEILESLASWATIAIENANLFQSGRERWRHLQELQGRLIHTEKMAALGRLVTSLAHEINNPLQAISMCLALIKESIDSLADAVDLQVDLGIAISEVHRLSSLMAQLRDDYRTENKTYQKTDVVALLRNVLHLTTYQLTNSDIEVQLHCDQDLPHLELNPQQLYQVFLNLILNAIDAMPDGGTLRIDATRQMEQADRWPLIQLKFCDSGSGITPENLPRIFEPFFTTKPTGTGLGLSISYEIITSFGGDITVSSSAGAGTTFIIHLPVQSP